MTLHALLTGLFPLEEINGRHVCPTYLYRWTLLRASGYGVYLHKFVGDDWTLDLHDHPKRFVSIGLWGGYTEETPSECPCDLHHEHSPQRRFFRAPWIRTFPASHVHRLTGPTPERPCWTLVLVGRPVREWGFWHFGHFIPWKRYVTSDKATERKACA